MFKKICKVVSRAFNWLFKEDEKEIEYNEVVRPFVRPVPVPVSPVPVRSVHPVHPVKKVAPAVPVRDLKQEYKEWSQNMRELDKLRQKLAQ